MHYLSWPDVTDMNVSSYSRSPLRERFLLIYQAQEREVFGVCGSSVRDGLGGEGVRPNSLECYVSYSSSIILDGKINIIPSQLVCFEG